MSIKAPNFIFVCSTGRPKFQNSIASTQDLHYEKDFSTALDRCFVLESHCRIQHKKGSLI